MTLTDSIPTPIGPDNPLHGRHPLVVAWSNMRRRCYDPTNKSFYRYGARGIVICEAWRDDYRAFMRWALSHGWAPGLTIDRIDGDGPYEPANCRWATRKVQSNNREYGRYLTLGDRTQRLSAWAEELGVAPVKISGRLNDGMTVERALTTPFGDNSRNSRTRLITARGKTRNLTEWATEMGVRPSTILSRIASGWTEERAVTTPKVGRSNATDANAKRTGP